MPFLFFEMMKIFVSLTKITTTFVHSSKNNSGALEGRCGLWPHKAYSQVVCPKYFLGICSYFKQLLPWASIEPKRKKKMKISPQELLSTFIKYLDKNTHPMCPCLRTFALASSSAWIALSQDTLLLLSLFMALIRGDLLRTPYLKLSLHPHPWMLCPPLI